MNVFSYVKGLLFLIGIAVVVSFPTLGPAATSDDDCPGWRCPDSASRPMKDDKKSETKKSDKKGEKAGKKEEIKKKEMKKEMKK